MKGCGAQLLGIQGRFALAAFGTRVELAGRNLVFSTALGAPYFKAVLRVCAGFIRLHSLMAFTALSRHAHLIDRNAICGSAPRALDNVCLRLCHYPVLSYS